MPWLGATPGGSGDGSAAAEAAATRAPIPLRGLNHTGYSLLRQTLRYCRCEFICRLSLPAADERQPLGVLVQVVTVAVGGGGRGFGRLVQQVHAGLLGGAPTLVVVAGGAGGDQVLPGMLAAQVAGDEVIDGEGQGVLPAVLASVVIPAQDFAFGQLDRRARAPDHLIQPDDRGPGEDLGDGFDLAAAVQDQAGPAGNDQGDGAPGVTHVNGLKVCIEHQDRGLHGGNYSTSRDRVCNRDIIRAMQKMTAFCYYYVSH